MAEINRIQIAITGKDDLSPILHAIQQSLTTFSQQTQQNTVLMAQLATAMQQMRQEQTQGTASTNQLATSYIAMAQAIQQQTQAYAQAQAAALAFRQQQAEAHQAARQATQATQQMAGLWRQMFAVAGGIGIATSMQGIVAELTRMGTESVKNAVQMQSLTAAFQAIHRSSSGAQQALAFVRAEATRIGVDFLSSAQAFKGLEAAARGTTLEGEKAKLIFTAVAEASRVMGLSADQTTHVLIAIEQMMSKGKVSAEELRRQMGNFLPGAFEIAARAMGVTTAELDKMLRSGQLLSEEFLPRFARQLREELGPGVAIAAQTAQATFARLGNEIFALSVKTGESILVILQPIARFLESTLRQTREAQERGAARRAQLSQEILTGKPGPGGGAPSGLPAGATQEEKAQELQFLERIAAMRQSIADIERAPFPFPGTLVAQQQRLAVVEAEYKTLVATSEARVRENVQLEMANSEETSRAKAGVEYAEAQARQKKAMEALLITLRELPVELRKAETISRELPTLYKSADEKLAAVRRSAEGLREALEQRPGLRTDPRIQQAIVEHERLAKGFQDEIDARKEAVRDARKEERTAERQETAAERLLSQLQRQLGAEILTREASEALDLQERIRLANLGPLTAATEAQAMALLKQAQAARQARETLEVQTKEEQQRRQQQWKQLDIFGLGLPEDREKDLRKARDFVLRVEDELARLQAPKEERREVQLRRELERLPLTPEQQAQVTETLDQFPEVRRAAESAKRQEAIYKNLGQNIQSAFDQMWMDIFTSGEFSAKKFGLSILEMLQRLFSQLTIRLLNELLNAIAQTDDTSGGWPTELAKLGVNALSNLGGSGGGGGASFTGEGLGTAFTATGGIIPAINTMAQAGLRIRRARYGMQPLSAVAFQQGGVMPALDIGLLSERLRYAVGSAGALQPLALQRGGIVRQPSFAVLGESHARQWEAVVPLPDNRSIPVMMTQRGGEQGQPLQPIIIQMHQDFSGAIDPRVLRTSPSEIIAVVAQDVSHDRTLRRVIVQHTR